MHKKHILIIDDEPDFTSLVKLSLEASGKFVVFEENDPRKAIAAARHSVPDLIILDMMMPGRHGGEVAADLREDAGLQNVPILFVTAMESHVPHHHYLPKPVDLHILAERVASLCGK